MSCLVVLVLAVSSLSAGENLDSLFVEARAAAMDSSSRPQAIEMCKQALDVSPDYHDFRILLGRCYSWGGQWDLAEEALTQVVAAAPDYRDAGDALLVVYIWSKQHDKAFALLDDLLVKYPDDLNLKLKKLRLLSELGSREEGLVLAKEILSAEPQNQEAREQLEQFRRTPTKVLLTNQALESRTKRSTTLRYVHNRQAAASSAWQFLVTETTLEPWHWVSLEHKKSFGFGPVLLKLNIANRFNMDGTQLEIESYPSLRKGTYLYLGAGASRSDLFPSFRMGMEVFQALPLDLECSLGFRVLQVPAKRIPIYVGSLGKYWQSYWFYTKTYLSPSHSSLSRSLVFGARRFLDDSGDYFELQAGSGISPDENLGEEETKFLGSRSFGASLVKGLGTDYDLRAGLSLSNLEIRSGNYRGDTGLEVAITRNF